MSGDKHQLDKMFQVAGLSTATRPTSILRSTTRSNSHRFVLERGRHSTISTVSPALESLSSSCTWQTIRERRILLYLGCLYNRSTSTRRDFCILSLFTIPISRFFIVVSEFRFKLLLKFLYHTSLFRTVDPQKVKSAGSLENQTLAKALAKPRSAWIVLIRAICRRVFFI